ncbi:NAD(P)/FAD-dependent oxidoreductase [Tateyamaria sp. SN6-1]|uniref:NAD(P)/FAD-dependent oxidoreductase n=1 Tax=Tateyamaria sp. SN6-1 TaxID=3092148 RepID=UPI0039F4D6ED
MTNRAKVVIIGAGFGGLTAAKALKRAPVDITILDRRNYHLFQPLLYQVATADLSPADVAWPIRSIFSRQKNVSVALTEVTDVDTENRQVIGESGTFDYDYLIVASGAHHAYFGKPHWEKHAPGLKRIVDATDIRKRVLMAFERAELTDDPAEQQRQMTFVVVGGGPTGVEMAGAIAELAHHTLARDFRRINARDARIILVEAGDRLLNAFPPALSDKARVSLEKLGVDVRLNTMVEDIDAHGVRLADGILPSACVVWGAGVAVPDVGRWLGADTDRAGRIVVNPDLSVPDAPEVFVIGDAAKIPWKDGQDVPGIAPAAKQGGAYVARRITRALKGDTQAGKPFTYWHAGNLATIGRHAAVIDMGRIHLSGVIAWWIWGLAHIYFLIGVRQPIFVALSWFWSYLTYAKGARLITGPRPKTTTPQTAAKQG